MIQSTSSEPLHAGFATAKITPPIGTRMFGWGYRDVAGGCESIHDDLFVRALWLEQGSEKMLIMGFDLLFFSRDIADRLRGALARRFGLEQRQILLNTSHTHSGPTTGTWWTALFEAPDRMYEDDVERATLLAAKSARESMREAEMLVGETTTKVATGRRLPDGNGGVLWKPDPNGTYDKVPICLIRDSKQQPICLMFSVSCHPSSFSGTAISAEYVGVAIASLDRHLGAECSMFLQGVGGDAKVRGFVNPDDFGKTWEDSEKGGEMVASDVISALNNLKPVKPHITSAETEVDLPMVSPLPTKAEYETWYEDKHPIRPPWAKRMVERIERGEQLPTHIPVTVHGVRLADGVVMIGMEGEAVADWGPFIEKACGGMVFPLGYTDGCQLYLPTTKMLDEGGYEVVSYFEYHWPAQFAAGIEDIIANAISKLQTQGIR